MVIKGKREEGKEKGGERRGSEGAPSSLRIPTSMFSTTPLAIEQEGPMPLRLLCSGAK